MDEAVLLAECIVIEGMTNDETDDQSTPSPVAGFNCLIVSPSAFRVDQTNIERIAPFIYGAAESHRIVALTMSNSSGNTV